MDWEAVENSVNQCESNSSLLTAPVLYAFKRADKLNAYNPVVSLILSLFGITVLVWKTVT